MTYGTYTTDANGEVVYTSSAQTVLDAPPMILNDSTMVPVRAISDGLGATTDWNSQTYTVYIISPATPADLPTSSPTASPIGQTASPIPGPTSDPFAATTHFEMLTPRRAQQLYDGNNKYAFVYFSSADADSMQYVPMIKEAAQSLGFKIYGVDAEEEYQGMAGVSDYRVNFIWNYVSSANMRYPTVFLVYGTNNVVPLIRPTNTRMVNDYLYDFFNNVTTPVPGYSGTWPTPYLPPSPTQNINEHWIELGSINQAINMYNDDESFILVYYWNGDDLSEDLLANVIKPASLSINVDIYGLDARVMSQEDRNKSWWARDAFPNLNVKYPAIFLVTDGVVSQYIQADNVSKDCYYYFDTWAKNVAQ
jgi:hypothetical protein